MPKDECPKANSDWPTANNYPFMAPHNDQAHIILRIVSQPQYLCVVRSAVESAAVRMGLSAQEAGQIVLAVDEAVSNVIRHGYEQEPNHPIWLRITPARRNGQAGVQVVVEDETEGVELSRIKGRPLEEVRPGGLGVSIIRAAMDEVSYQHRDDGPGIRLTMSKFARPDQPAGKG